MCEAVAVSAADYSTEQWRDLNHAWWEERAPHHADSGFYREGGGLEDFEWEDIGSVAGLDVIHPQCHIGTDTISLAQGGAMTVGLDFSAAAIEAAPKLAAKYNVAERCDWLVADVYDATAAVGGRTFDLVYTGKGALCWLPDMDRWARVMWALCRAGGRFYVSEFHPSMDQMHDDSMEFERDYFPVGGGVYVTPGSYAAPDIETEHNATVDFVHPLSEVVQALLDVGFQLTLMREFPFVVYERWPWMVSKESGVWEMPEGQLQIPMMYSLLLQKPE